MESDSLFFPILTTESDGKLITNWKNINQVDM
jgi:hypothetical protein